MAYQNILIVDDDAIVRQVLRRSLNRVQPKLSVKEAGTVAAALHNLEDTSITSVVTDFHLPDGTGLSVLTAALSRIPALPVLMISSDPRVATLALKEGASAFISKPFALDELLRVLEQLVNI